MNPGDRVYAEPFHAVGPGKQFPPVIQSRGKPEVLAAKQSNASFPLEEPNADPADASQQSLDVSTGDESSASWKVYDAAASLLRERRKRAGFTVTQSPSMILSSQFTDSETILRNIAVNDAKVDLVHFAFDHAAQAVLKAIQNASASEDDSSTPDSIVGGTWKKDLPAVLSSAVTDNAPTSLASLRSHCMQRSFENKEYAKRKGGKTDAVIPRPVKPLKPKLGTKAADAVVSSKVDVTTNPEGKDFNPENSSTDPPETMDASIHESREGNNIETVHSSIVTNPVSSNAVKSGRSSQTNVSQSYTRALLCAVGNIVFEKLTPGPGLAPLDALSIPQESLDIANKDALLLDAKAMAQRAISTVQNVVQRSKLRYRYRKDNARFQQNENDHFLLQGHPFGFSNQNDDVELLNDCVEMGSSIPYQPNPKSMTSEWEQFCCPHFVSILETGSGHAIYMDVQWSSRHGRISNLLNQISDSLAEDNLGPHLIITMENDMLAFAQEFYEYNCHQRFGTKALCALTYRGSKLHRRRLRKMFSRANGLPSAAFHVLITSYDIFFEDYLHFCQLPFDTVILDGGAAIQVAKERNVALGIIWDSALFSANDHHAGLAGTSEKEWDFTRDDIPENVGKEAWIGLTTRHRIITTSTLAMPQHQGQEPFPVSSLLTFVMPQFMDLVKEEWDLSGIASDTSSMAHFRKLLARAVVVHGDSSDIHDMQALALNALNGQLGSSDRWETPDTSVVLSDDCVSTGKISVSQKSTLEWLGPPSLSWLRYTLSSIDFQPIMDAMKLSTSHGHYCEEITPASTLTSSGANGQISGTSAFRLAVCCGRHFGSELGLRQHKAAQHAPSGTWLCRTCSCDCITSQARSFHEKLCGKPTPGAQPERTGSSSPGPSVGPSGIKKGPSKAKFSRVGAMNLKSDKKDADANAMLGEGDIDGAKILSVINIKDLPPDVKPLLRDPRQTSRTGGNSKRHIYAYRGVCRQARKGHDRWQSQISFMGINHYLGTFDSEWDAAAIYAWAHLLLYGEEATKLAQKEGEEAAAAYEQEKRDIAAGKLPETTLKPDKKKKAKIKEPNADSDALDTSKRKSKLGKKESAQTKTHASIENSEDLVESDVLASSEIPGEDTSSKKRGKQSIQQDNAKKARSAAKGPNIEKEALALILAKGVSKVPMLAPRVDLFNFSDSDLIGAISRKLKLSRTLGDLSAAEEYARPCIPVGATKRSCIGGAVLVGLSASVADWDLQQFFEEQQHSFSEQDSMAALQLLAVEYDEDGINEKFHCVIQGSLCMIGCAGKLTQEMYSAVGLGSVPVGGTVGNLDCHIGGVLGSCSEEAACIQYDPNNAHFQLSCLSADDIVTLNGQRVTPESGRVPLFHDDICSVGARVFAFLLPKEV